VLKLKCSPFSKTSKTILALARRKENREEMLVVDDAFLIILVS